MSKAEQIQAWYPSANGLIEQFERLRELVALTQRNIDDGVEPLNWPTIRRCIRDSAKQGRFSRDKFESIGLTLEDIPEFGDIELVAVGDHRFNSVLQAVAWGMLLWSTVGTEVHSAMDDHQNPMEIPTSLWRFMAMLSKNATTKIVIPADGPARFENEWINTPLGIDPRICTAGIRAEILRIATAPPKSPHLQSKQNQIPSKYRSKPISKRRAAELLGRKGNRSSITEWLSKCIADGTIKADPQSRQNFVFDIRDFPASAHRHLRPDN